MKSREDDSIEFGVDPYRMQLERTLEILEMEIEHRKAAESEELEASRENQLLNQRCIEQRNVIDQLKTQLHALLAKSTKDQCVATDETNETIQKALDKIRPYKDKYQDLYPTLAKLVIEDTMPRAEVEYDDRTVKTILEEAYGPVISLSGMSSSNVSSKSNLSSAQPSPRDPPTINSQTMSPNLDNSKKKGFDWGIFKKFTGADKDTSSGSHQKSKDANLKEKSSKSLKEWENILSEIGKGKSVWALRTKIENQFKAGSSIPQHMRCVLWGKLLGNRSRVTSRIYKMLLLQLPNANPQVKKCIVLDVNRSFSALSKSEEFEKVKQESIKILQLFEVKLISSDPQTGYRLRIWHVFHCSRPQDEHEHLPCVPSILQSGFR